MNNKELVNAGHELAKAISNDTPLIEIAKMVSNLATQLDVQLARSNALAAENAGLKDAAEFATAPDMWEELGGNVMRYQYQEWYADRLKSAMETPATDDFLAEVRAQGVEMFAAYCGEENSVFVEAKAYYRSLPDAAYEFAAQLRKGVQS
ncbi:TPA: hypothetical protein QHQ91_002898 [Enterobacter ludwigii]|nr:hypothetical protein [Enterobacter ludwigii]HDW0217959.1 hypothetical protein [Enterobacter ludwigii]HDW0232680.1 hypothetical protein [Enterobacter ludwigii]